MTNSKVQNFNNFTCYIGLKIFLYFVRRAFKVKLEWLLAKLLILMTFGASTTSMIHNNIILYFTS